MCQIFWKAEISNPKWFGLMPSFQPNVIRIDLVLADTDEEHYICHLRWYQLKVCTSTPPNETTGVKQPFSVFFGSWGIFNCYFLDIMLLNFGVSPKALNPCSETVVIDVERLTSRHFCYEWNIFTATEWLEYFIYFLHCSSHGFNKNRKSARKTHRHAPKRLRWWRHSKIS